MLGTQLPQRAQSQAPASGELTAEDLPDGPGRDEAFYSCTACHSFKLVAAQGMTRERWDETLTWMTERQNMPEITGADRDTILDYLAQHYPPRQAPGSRPGWQNPFATP